SEDLVQDHQLMLAGLDLLTSELQALLGGLAVLFQRVRIAEDVDEADAGRDDLEVWSQPRRASDLAERLALRPLAHLRELDHADVPAPADGAQRDAEGGRRLALALAGVEQHLAAHASRS